MTQVIIMVALSAEAQPIVASLGLRGSQSARAFRSYHGDNCHLIVSGMGRVRAAAACGWAGAVIGGLKGGSPQPLCWINAGICGHGSRATGSVIRASSIHDAGAGRSYFPPDIFPSKLPADRLVTVDQPQREYADDTAYDMEASAFWTTATRFSSSELMTTLKVVSDGSKAELENLDRTQIVQLSGNLAAPVQSTIQALVELAAETCESPVIDDVFGRIVESAHFSVSRQRQLRQILGSLNIHDALPEPADEKLLNAKSAQQVLDELNDRLEAIPINLVSGRSQELDCG